MTAVLDAGALIAIDRHDRAVGAMLRVLQRDGIPVHTSAAAVAQVWRNGGRQANLARVLPGVDIHAMGEGAKKVGELIRTSASTDIVDAHVTLLVPENGSILTSDDADIKALLRARRVKARIVHV
jgi:hypothetical protein